MGNGRFADLQTRPTAGLDVTRLTLEAFQPLVPPVEAACQGPMAEWRLDGQPRTARRYTTDQHGPLPTPEDRLLCILVYLNTYAWQVVQGRRFGMGQRKAHQWMHVLLGGWQAALHTLGDAPTRAWTALAQRIGVTEADAAAIVRPTEGRPPPADPPAVAPVPAPVAPLLAMMAPNDASSAPRSRLSRRAVIAVSTSATP